MGLILNVVGELVKSISISDSSMVAALYFISLAVVVILNVVGELVNLYLHSDKDSDIPTGVELGEGAMSA